MAVKLSRTAYEYAQDQIKAGHVVIDERDDWSEHQPSAAEENRFIEEHGYGEHAKWHLAIQEGRATRTAGGYGPPPRVELPEPDPDRDRSAGAPM
jgi:hypothetical protein